MWISCDFLPFLLKSRHLSDWMSVMKHLENPRKMRIGGCAQLMTFLHAIPNLHFPMVAILAWICFIQDWILLCFICMSMAHESPFSLHWVMCFLNAPWDKTSYDLYLKNAVNSSSDIGFFCYIMFIYMLPIYLVFHIFLGVHMYLNCCVGSHYELSNF